MLSPQPTGFTRLHELLEPWVRQDAGVVAVADPHTAFTFGGLQSASIEAAATLSSLGVRAGDRVLVVGENCAALAVLLFALSRLDAWICIVTGVPAMYSRLLEWLAQGGRTLRAPALRVAGVAGAPLTDTLKAGVERALGVPLLNGYGMTEAAPTIAQVRAGAPRADCAVGPAIPGIQVRIVRDPADPAADVGELWMRGPNVMKGYYRNEALTREVIDADGWLNTGDLARLGPDGVLHVVGRTKDLIIRSGFNVYPVEVEQVHDAYPGVTQSAVVGRTTADNEEVIAYLEVTAGGTIDEQALRSYLRDRLSPYKIPAEIHCMAQLPAAPTGKLLKGVLRAMAQQAVPATPTGA